MRVSIVMPYYNAAQYIVETVNSIIAQTHKDWELIIVDDCSEDNSAKIINQYVKKDKRIKYYKLKHKNIICEIKI